MNGTEENLLYVGLWFNVSISIMVCCQSFRHESCMLSSYCFKVIIVQE